MKIPGGMKGTLAIAVVVSGGLGLVIGLLVGSGGAKYASSAPSHGGATPSSGGSASAGHGAPSGNPASATATWSCVATDNGDQNPGPGCPSGSGYHYSGITSSDGYNTKVINDMWNPPGPGHPQTIYVNNPGDWKVVSDQPQGNTAVLSYPNVEQIFTRTDNSPAPLSGFKTISSSFRESMPSGGDNEAAYDIWLGTAAKGNYSQEIMIWVDNHRTNPPPGSIVGRPAFDGVTYTVWDDNGTVYMLRDGNEESGSVDILSMLDWLKSRGLSPADSGLNQIDFGWEICSTDSKPETFVMTGYDLRIGCESKGTSCYAS